jgi:hypothetical protein
MFTVTRTSPIERTTGQVYSLVAAQ